MTLTNRFDPKPDEPNGHCLVCDAVFATQEEGDQHMSETLVASSGRRGHRILRTNPSRKDRIDSAIWDIFDDALSSACSEIDDLLARDHITEEEAATAIREQHTSLEEAWEEYNA